MAARLPSALPAIVCALALAGCQGGPKRDPLPYSPNYRFVDGSGAGVVRKGYEAGAARGGLVPDACITPDVAADPLYLPPGCANNLNLQLMAERQSDLLRGRSTGPAMAAPSVRAARAVIDGPQVAAPASAAQAEGEVDTTGSLD